MRSRPESLVEMDMNKIEEMDDMQHSGLTQLPSRISEGSNPLQCRVVSISDAAAILNVRPRLVLNLVCQGKVPASKDGRQIMISVDQIDSLLIRIHGQAPWVI